MTAPLTLPRSTAERSAADEDLNHVVCDCDENRALCGTDATDMPWSDDGTPCVVCEDLEPVPCERCSA